MAEDVAELVGQDPLKLIDDRDRRAAVGTLVIAVLDQRHRGDRRPPNVVALADGNGQAGRLFLSDLLTHVSAPARLVLAGSVDVGTVVEGSSPYGLPAISMNRVRRGVRDAQSALRPEHRDLGPPGVPPVGTDLRLALEHPHERMEPGGDRGVERAALGQLDIEDQPRRPELDRRAGPDEGPDDRAVLGPARELAGATTWAVGSARLSLRARLTQNSTLRNSPVLPSASWSAPMLSAW